MAERAGVPLLSGPYQDPLASAGSDAAASVREPSPTSDQEDAAPVSKMRRRWRLTSRKAAQSTLLPMEDSPGSSGATSSWQMVAPPCAPHFDVESISDGDDVRSPSFCGDSATNAPALSARSFFRPAPKPKAWQRPPVCLRFNSPFQVDQPEPKPVARPAGSCRNFRPQAAWRPHCPVQRERASWSTDAAPLPSFGNAHVYAKYPSQQESCLLDSTLRCPTPAPLPPRVEPPGALPAKAITFKAPRPLTEEAGFSRSMDAHAEVSRKNHLLFEQLCDMHFELSPVLGQISTSRYSEVLRNKLLAKVSDTTAARYLRSVQIFFTTFEELGGEIRNVEAGLLLDTFFSLSRCPEEGPLSNSLNVMKALRWYRKLLGLSPFPDLYSAAFASLVQPASGEKRESLPLPLSFHSFLERKVLDSETPAAEAIWAGSFLACIGGSLRFSDAQHVLWSSLCVSPFTLRGICYRTKTTKRGAPFAFLGFGTYSSGRDFGENWLSVWIFLLDKVWQDLRASFGAQVAPDCFFFTLGQQGFSPASYAQTLLRLRNFLQEAGIPQAQALSYTLHSLKVTMLSWMAQLDLPLSARTLQGHHALAGSMQLYSRDDVWPALRAQLSVWEAIQRGFTPMLPQHRGGQNPLQENAPVLSGFPQKRQTSSLSCFALSSDAQSFLAWQASQREADSASAALCSLPLQQQESQLPKPLCRAPQFEDSDGDVGPASEHTANDPEVPAGAPAWKEVEAAVEPAATASVVPLQGTPSCAEVRFLLSSSGIAHLSIFHSGSRMLCLACRSENCQFRCQPACGCFSEFSAASVLPSNARLCRRRACVIASAGDC